MSQRDKNLLRLATGIVSALLLSLLVVYFAQKYNLVMSRDLFPDSILLTNMISVAISLFAFSRYVVLRERLLEFMAFAFLIGGFTRIAGVIVSDSWCLLWRQSSFHFSACSLAERKVSPCLNACSGYVIDVDFPQIQVCHL